MCYNFQNAVCINEEKRKEFNDLINYMDGNLPEFSAAGFFSIDKSTVVNIFFTVVNFIILFIQLLSNYEQVGKNSQKIIT